METHDENMYRCGHRNGMLVEFWPGDILALCDCISRSPSLSPLELFARVADPRNYIDERLQVSSEEALDWGAAWEARIRIEFV